MNIYLLQYNNYGNRTIKGYSLKSAYTQYQIASELGVNRSISDNLSCSITFNDTEGDITSTSMPNYCLICDDEDNIVSRWFVLSCKHKGGTRIDSVGGQYTIELKRDVIYDFHTNIENSTVLCSRGYKDITSPLFLNKDTDQFPVNRIKYKEVLLKEKDASGDDINFPWIYIYRSKTNAIRETFDNQVDYGYENLVYTSNFNPSGAALNQDNTHTYTDEVRLTYDDATITCNGVSLDIGSDEISDLMKAGLYGIKTLDAVENVYALIETNKPIDFKLKYLFKDGFIYELTYNSPNPALNRLSFSLVIPGTFKSYMIKNQALKNMIDDAIANNRQVQISLAQILANTLVITNKRDGGGTKFTFYKDGLSTNGQFDILVVPYADITINGKQYTKRWADLLISSLALNSNTYDIQILSYGPAKLNKISEGNYYLYEPYFTCRFDALIGSSAPSTEIGDSIYNHYHPLMMKEWKREFEIEMPSEFKKDASNNDEDYAYVIPNTANTNAKKYEANKKGLNCYDIRLVSPDSQSIEELNPFFNYSTPTNSDPKGELVKGFNIYMKLQPFMPYNQVLPKFKGSGWNFTKDFEDYRGLICGSGFSLAMANDKWAEFVLNNKNYSAQFDREIESMRFNQINSGITGLAGVAGSAMTGGMAGGAAGAIIGAGFGALGLVSNMAAHEFNIETAKKEFRWNIQNIQNMSRTLKQIDAQNPNFRFFPYIEIYKCTDDEATRLLGYIKHHGSHIGAEGLFTDFIDSTHNYPYIECVIDIYAGNNVSADVLDEINRELSMGVKYEV